MVGLALRQPFADLVHGRRASEIAKRREFGDRAAAYFHRQAFRAQTPFAADRARARGDMYCVIHSR